MRRSNPPAGVNRLQADAVTCTQTSSARIQLDLIGGINKFMPNMTTHTKKSDLQDEQIKMLTRCHTIAEINSIRNKFAKYNRDALQSPASPRKKGFPPIVSNAGPYCTTAARFNEYAMMPRLTRQREKLREIQEEMNNNIKKIPTAGSKMTLRRLEGYELRGSKISNLEKNPTETVEMSQHASNTKTLPGDKQGSYFPTPTAMRKAIENYKDKKQMKYSEERHVRHLDKEGKSTAITAYIKRQINQKRMLHQPHADDQPNGLGRLGDANNKKHSARTKLTNGEKSASNINGVNTYVLRDHSDKVQALTGSTTFNLTTKNLEIYDFITNPRTRDEEDEEDEGYVDERVVTWVMDRQVDPSNMPNITEGHDAWILPSLTGGSPADLRTFTERVVDDGDGEMDVNTMYSPSRATTTT